MLVSRVLWVDWVVERRVFRLDRVVISALTAVVVL